MHRATCWRISCLLCLALLGLVSACRSGPPATLSDRMLGHFQDAFTVQTGLILGDLDRARSAARRLASEDGVHGVPADASDELAAFRGRARGVAQARTLSDAIESAGEMAAACGACHESQGTGPVFPAPGTAPEGGHMVEHIWAADRLWEGLVQPASGRWEAGARVLARHEVPMDLVDAETSELGMRLKALGIDALAVGPGATRAGLYRDIVATCSGCHTARR